MCSGRLMAGEAEDNNDALEKTDKRNLAMSKRRCSFPPFAACCCCSGRRVSKGAGRDWRPRRGRKKRFQKNAWL